MKVRKLQVQICQGGKRTPCPKISDTPCFKHI